MAITGTGTQNDPYIVTTWDEFVEKAAISGAYIKLGNDINLNDEYPEGITSQTLVRCTEIDGDNHIIKNLANKNCCIFYPPYNTFVTIKNTKFLNCCLKGSSFVYNNSTAGITFSLCSFNGELYENAVFSSQTATLRRCSMNFDLHGNSTSASFNNGEQTYYYYCNIKLKNGILRMNGENNYVTGENMSVLVGSGKYNVFDVSIPTENYITFNDNHYRGYYNTNSLINDDKVEGTKSFNANDGNYALTTEDLTNAEYLSSIGFPIQT